MMKKILMLSLVSMVFFPVEAQTTREELDPQDNPGVGNTGGIGSGQAGWRMINNYDPQRARITTSCIAGSRPHCR
ncbi:hypothetical protein J3U88_13485 [Acanthopleuribacter pedis]|uniref:Uncharacterized protein n=1 Tax=Acanthopleuribacter pedis TaxID=442870 RepID=A0A8J7QEU7_9BACT|nr:hypothetical protein [Acanthopleuribacter pedis]